VEAKLANQSTLSYRAIRAGTRILELENRCTGNRTVGSNPTLSVSALWFPKGCGGFADLSPNLFAKLTGLYQTRDVAPGLAKGSWPRNRDWQQLVAYRTGRPDPSFLLQSNGKTHMTDIIPTAAEAKDLADDCCEALAELLSRPMTTARHPITQQILAEMQKTLSDESWAEAIGSPIKTYLGFNSIHLCMRSLRSHGHLAQAARIEAALEAAAGRLSEDTDDDVDPTIN
jgi:hypothetical protein